MKKNKTMKTLILLLALIISGCYNGEVPVQTGNELTLDSSPTKYDSVTTTIKNGRFSQNDTIYTFDIYSKSKISSLRMGNTTMTFEIESNGTPLRDFRFTYVNPKYTLGSGVGYLPMLLEVDEEGNDEYIYIQVVLENEGLGSLMNQSDELICTVEARAWLNIFDIVWDTPLCFMWYPNRTIENAWIGQVSGW